MPPCRGIWHVDFESPLLEKNELFNIKYTPQETDIVMLLKLSKIWLHNYIFITRYPDLDARGLLVVCLESSHRRHSNQTSFACKPSIQDVDAR